MEEQTFDALTRSVGSEAGARRSLFRSLSRSALTALAGNLGGDEVVATKPTRLSSLTRRRKPSGLQSVGAESFCRRCTGMCYADGCPA